VASEFGGMLAARTVRDPRPLLGMPWGGPRFWIEIGAGTPAPVSKEYQRPGVVSAESPVRGASREIPGDPTPRFFLG